MVQGIRWGWYSRHHFCNMLGSTRQINERTWGQAEDKVEANNTPPPQVGYVWYSSNTPGCQRTGEKKESKCLTGRDLSHAGQESPSVYG